MTSVKSAAEEVNKYKEDIDIFIANAAVVSPPGFLSSTAYARQDRRNMRS